jgi:hypothetical protein
MKLNKSIATALAHERRSLPADHGRIQLVVGFHVEPAFEDNFNAVDVILKTYGAPIGNVIPAGVQKKLLITAASPLKELFNGPLVPANSPGRWYEWHLWLPLRQGPRGSKHRHMSWRHAPNTRREDIDDRYVFCLRRGQPCAARFVRLRHSRPTVPRPA